MTKNGLMFGLIVLLGATGCSPSGKPVAVVNGTEISSNEFAQRLKHYLESTGVRDNILVRKEIVGNMINEVLILEEIARNKWEDEPEVRKRFEEIEHQALLDQVAKDLVRDIQISEGELREEFRKANTRVAVRYVYGPTMEEARSLKKKLENGTRFETLAREIFDDPGLANNGGFLGYVGMDDLAEDFAETALALPVGTLSDPVKIQAGYAILRVEDRKTIPLKSETDYGNVKHRLEDAVRQRKVRQVIQDAAGTIGENLDIRFHEANLDLIMQYWNVNGIVSPEMTPEQLPLRPEAEVAWVQSRLLTLEEFLVRLEFVTEKQKKRVTTKDDLKTLIRGLETRSVLLSRAKREGFGRNKAVRDQIANVRKSYLLKRWARIVQEEIAGAGIGEEILTEYYERNKDQYRIPPEVNVAEILVRSREDAERLMVRLSNGESFAALARKHSIRTWAAQRGGELGYGSIAQFGHLGDRFFRTPLNGIIGPEAVDPYVGIFKVIGRRDGRVKTYEEAKEDIMAQLLFAKKREGFKARVEGLRTGASITVNEEALAHVPLP